ncbi:type II toxin-antitoxin system RelE/ParE family toxin [Pseudomonas wuhanensis]|uniref:type II toxin-antitoxin system RelE/ParE family toxin n=1 Tax=Pseudomonas TaxID=286 RepID=UPI0032AEB8E9
MHGRRPCPDQVHIVSDSAQLGNARQHDCWQFDISPSDLKRIDKQQLTATPTTLLANPRIGERLEEFEPRDVRRIQVGHYEMRYEIAKPVRHLQII